MAEHRHISEKGVRFIAKFEGFEAHAYKPVAAERWYTIGYGHTSPSVGPHDTVTKEQARDLLRKDCRKAEAFVRDLVRVKLNQHQRDALISFVFNVGGGAFSTSTLLRLLNEGNYVSVPAQLSRWVNGESGPLEGLVARRRAEGVLFSRGRYH